MMDVSALEKFLGELIGRFRREEIDPLRRRLDAIEQRLALEERIAKLEARAAGIESVEAHLIRPEHASWRNGSGR